MALDTSTAPRQGLVEANGSKLIGRYDDFASYIHDAQHVAAHQNSTSQKYHKHWMEDANSNWYGLDKDHNFEQVRDLTLAGWPEGLMRMDKALGSLEIDVPPISIRRRRLRSDFGDELDIHRVYSGDVAHAFTTMKRPPGSKRKPLSIVVDSIASGGRDADSMFWQGAAAIKLGELLSNAGYTVELYSAFKARAHCDVDLRVLTKASGAPLDLCSAAATLALPAFFRCIGHAWIHANLSTSHSSSGVSVEELSESDGDFVATQSLDNQEQAVEWVQKCIDKMQNPDEADSSDEDEEEQN